jgi:hypothetical protein
LRSRMTKWVRLFWIFLSKNLFFIPFYNFDSV